MNRLAGPLRRKAGRGDRDCTDRGFTLVELMVVMVILGLIGGAAVLAIPETNGLRAEAERFAARAKAAQEAALINARATSVRVDQAGYSVAHNRGGAWQDVARYEWEAGTRPDFGTGLQARSLFDPTGVADPLEVNLRRADQRVQVVIGSDGEIDVRR